MPKSNTYMDRALKSRDPRFARILGKLGYERSDMVAAPPPAEPIRDEMAELRAEYETLLGKRPFMGWSAETLRQKMAEYRAPVADDLE